MTSSNEINLYWYGTTYDVLWAGSVLGWGREETGQNHSD